MKKINSTKFLGNIIVENDLDLFVKYGVLIEKIENGEKLYKNNPDFDKLSKEEQGEVFEEIQKEKHA